MVSDNVFYENHLYIQFSIDKSSLDWIWLTKLFCHQLISFLDFPIFTDIVLLLGPFPTGSFSGGEWQRLLRKFSLEVIYWFIFPVILRFLITLLILSFFYSKSQDLSLQDHSVVVSDNVFFENLSWVTDLLWNDYVTIAVNRSESGYLAIA